MAHAATQLIFERNEDFWAIRLLPRKLVFRWSAESAQRLVELQWGRIRRIDKPGPESAVSNGIQNDSSLQLAVRNGTNVFYVSMNNTYPPFDNERVRQAFCDRARQRIIDNFYPPGSSIATQFMPPSIFGYSEGQDLV